MALALAADAGDRAGRKGGRVSGSSETKTYGKGTMAQWDHAKPTLPRRGIFGKESDEK